LNPGGFAAALAEVPSLVPEFAVRAPLLTEILRRWRDVEPMLRRATARTQGCFEPEDVMAQICTGRCTMLWIERGSELQAVAVTEVRNFPRKRVLDVGFIGAKPGADTGVTEWAPILTETLTEMARAVGASMLSGCGRIGWARVAGFRIAGAYVTKVVT
jgi:hypothetical protein